MALMGEEQVAAQRVQALALVELASYPSAEFFVGDVAADIDGAHEPPVLVQRLGEATLAAAGVQLGNEQASGGVAELHRGDQSEQVVPVFGDQLGLDRLIEQRPGVRVSSAPAGAGSEAVELEAADVSDAWGELQPGQVEDRERRKGVSGGVDGVLAERQIRWVAEDLIEHRDGLTPGGRDDFGAVSGMLIGDVGVCRCSLVEEVPRQCSGGQATAALREPLPVR